jgi:hypothetical protein
MENKMEVPQKCGNLSNTCSIYPTSECTPKINEGSMAETGMPMLYGGTGQYIIYGISLDVY